jgi:hypothetical protein
LNIKVKTEKTHTGNLFIEEWSNRGLKPGWLHNLTNCDRLYYYFLDTADLYILDMSSLRIFMNGGLQGRLEFKFLRQEKNAQANNTWGWLVPLTALRLWGTLVLVREEKLFLEGEL